MPGSTLFSNLFRRTSKEKGPDAEASGPEFLVHPGVLPSPGKGQKFQWSETEYVRPNLYSSARSEPAPVFLKYCL